MLAIRFSRRGKRNQPFFRIIVSEKAKDTVGDFLEDLGFYNPRSKEVSFKKERILHWINCGAKPSATVHNLLIKHSIIEGQKIKVMRRHKKDQEKKEVAVAPAPVA